MRISVAFSSIGDSASEIQNNIAFELATALQLDSSQVVVQKITADSTSSTSSLVALNLYQTNTAASAVSSVTTRTSTSLESKNDSGMSESLLHGAMFGRRHGQSETYVLMGSSSVPLTSSDPSYTLQAQISDPTSSLMSSGGVVAKFADKSYGVVPVPNAMSDPSLAAVELATINNSSKNQPATTNDDFFSTPGGLAVIAGCALVAIISIVSLIVMCRRKPKVVDTVDDITTP
jgi:hypothetical protein